MIAIFPELVATAASGDVERLAILVRRYFGGETTFAPCPKIQGLISAAGLQLRHLAMDAHGALLGKDERGAFTITIVVSQDLEPHQERFMMAHMLGHYLLDVQPVIARGDWQVSGYREVACPLKRYVAGGDDFGANAIERQREARADQFAAALLLPRGMVKRALDKIGDIDRAAAFFGVTRGCLERRMVEMELIPDQPVNFLDAERQAFGEPAAPAPAKPLTAPVEGAMPRAFAASTYGATEKSTRQAAPASRPEAPKSEKPKSEAPKAVPKKAEPTAAPRGLGGMDRIRELARKLDKGASK